MGWLNDRGNDKMNVSRDQVRRLTGLELFSDDDINEITELLKAVDQITQISWEFEERRGLVVSGLDTDVGDVVLSHPRSARAYLDAYLLGYYHGKSDGKEDE